MTTKNPECFHMSASAINSFKACPQRYRLAYREGIRKAEDTDAQRVGTNWHALHEVYHNAFEDDGHETALQAALDHLNEQYEEVPASKTPKEWEAERQILITCFIGYLWYWSDDPVETVGSEVPFDLPLHAPRTGLPLPKRRVKRLGKIDHVGKWQGKFVNVERKSTTKSVAHDSDYWERSQKDTQVSMYALACRDMIESGTLPDEIRDHPDFDPEKFGNTLYDVWHKPTSKPKKISQKETEEFRDSKLYYEQPFEVEFHYDDTVEGATEGVCTGITVDGVEAEFERGKDGKPKKDGSFKPGQPAIVETPAMFAARLLADIQERPEFYFARREIARTDQDIARFRTEVFNIYQAQKLYADNGVWFENENQCRATFHCEFIPICYGPGADHICETGETPPGFKRRFTEPTVEGDPVGE